MAGSRKSPLSKTQNQRRNTQTGRDHMSSSNFALPKGTGSDPSRDQYRIDDRAHAANAKARVAQHGTPAEKRTVRRKVAERYPSLADDQSGSNTGNPSGTGSRNGGNTGKRGRKSGR